MRYGHIIQSFTQATPPHDDDDEERGCRHHDYRQKAHQSGALPPLRCPVSVHLGTCRTLGRREVPGRSVYVS